MRPIGKDGKVAPGLILFEEFVARWLSENLRTDGLRKSDEVFDPSH
jgi:hypothetical protein